MQGLGRGVIIMPLEHKSGHRLAFSLFKNHQRYRKIKRQHPFEKKTKFFDKNQKSEYRKKNHNIGTLIHGTSIPGIK